MRFSSGIAILVLIFCATAGLAADEGGAAQRILDAEAAEAAGWAARDIEAIMNAYAPDAIVLLGGSPPVGVAQLRKLFLDFLADPAFTLTFRSDTPLVAASGEVGVTVGTYELTFTDPDAGAVGRKTGRHLMTWGLQGDGAWRVIRQMTAHDR